MKTIGFLTVLIYKVQTLCYVIWLGFRLLEGWERSSNDGDDDNKSWILEGLFQFLPDVASVPFDIE